MIVCLLTVAVQHNFSEILFLHILCFTNQPFRLFCNSVGFQFDKYIQDLRIKFGDLM